MSVEKLQVYKCEICGNIVEVLTVGGGTLTCCGQPMTKLEEKTADAATEKHVPVVEETTDGIKVKVGSVPHPMTEEHRIEWIQVISGDRVIRKFLSSTDAPEAEFPIKTSEVKSVREFCNLHGLWKK